MYDINVNPAKPQQRHNFQLSNIVSNFDDLSRASLIDKIKNSEQNNFNFEYMDQTQNQTIIQRILYFINLTNPNEWFFLSVFSIIATSNKTLKYY